MKILFSCYFCHSYPVLGTSLYLEHLEKTQALYHNVSYMSDSTLWGISDYWATPEELLTLYKGDCEDIAIAKYFSLIDKQIPYEHLRLTFVYLPNQDASGIHMVLELHLNNEIYVSDNRYEYIYLANQSYMNLRIASFNHQFLWVNENVVSKSIERLDKWAHLLQRHKKSNHFHLYNLEQLRALR
ncbi:transglutaminase-like cysteine peptidase [Vibrio owensii]|uniref:transglutaminase-like cysteine peptidase n=1 Tax=Vibrio owensii TaxID=696485 RepID=UPI003AAD149D